MAESSLVTRYRALAASGGNLSEIEANDLILHGPCPIDMLAGRSTADERLWTPLCQSFAAARRRTDILLTGRFQDAGWIATSGHWTGVFRQDWLGIPATDRFAWLRFGRFDRVSGDRIVESRLLLDLSSLMMQAGCWPLAPSPGPDVMAPGPEGQDGLGPHGDGLRSLDLVQSMIRGLMRYDGRSLASMGMRDFWTPDFRWYGPGPIGCFAGHEDYERGHQRPFLRAFPDRVGGNHVCRIGEGDYVGSTGWPSVRATHSGDGWLGLAASGKPIGMRVMDFWRREGDRLAENWVMIDIPDLLRQLGRDVFAGAL